MSIRLNGDDRRAIVTLLTRFPLFQSERGRRELLELADLGVVSSQIALEGAPLIVASELVRTLEAFGRVTYDQEALGRLLNTTKTLMGRCDDEAAAVDAILMRYSLMTPAAVGGAVGAWRGDDMATHEKIVGENTLRHIAFLEIALHRAKSVALVDVGEWTGTGFLITPSLLLTNQHVVPSAALLRQVQCRFNFQLRADGSAAKPVSYGVRPDGVYVSDAVLDFAILELDVNAGDEWGVVPMSLAPVSTGQRVNIIQHPAGLPKQVSLQNNRVAYTDGRVVQYLTSTLNGSSGSPVFDDNWGAVALHHAGGLIVEPQTGRTYFRNEGVLLSPIIEQWPEAIRKRVTFAKGNSGSNGTM